MEKSQLPFERGVLSGRERDYIASCYKVLYKSLNTDESSLSKVGRLKLKRDAMSALHSVMTYEFGVKENSIGISVEKGEVLPDFVRASWQGVVNPKGEKGYLGDVVVADKFLKESDLFELLNVLLHEYRHGLSDINYARGGKYPKTLTSIDYDEDSELDVRLFLLKHSVNLEELRADMFASSKILEWCKNAKKSGKKNKFLTKSGRRATVKIAKRVGDFAKGATLSVLASPVSIANDALKSFKYNVNSFSDMSEIYERNLLNERRALRSVSVAKDFLERASKKQKLTSGDKLRTADMMAVLLADKIGVPTSELGVIMLDTEKDYAVYLPNAGFEGGNVRGVIGVPLATLGDTGAEFTKNLADKFQELYERGDVQKSNDTMSDILGTFHELD